MLVQVSPAVFSEFSRIVNDEFHKLFLTAYDSKTLVKFAFDPDWSQFDKAYVIESENWNPKYFINDKYVESLGYQFFDEKIKVNSPKKEPDSGYDGCASED